MQLKTSIDNAATDIDVDVFARMKRVVIFYGVILLSKSEGENHERNRDDDPREENHERNIDDDPRANERERVSSTFIGRSTFPYNIPFFFHVFHDDPFRRRAERSELT